MKEILGFFCVCRSHNTIAVSQTKESSYFNWQLGPNLSKFYRNKDYECCMLLEFRWEIQVIVQNCRE